MFKVCVKGKSNFYRFYHSPPSPPQDPLSRTIELEAETVNSSLLTVHGSCGLTLADNSAPPSCLITLPWWDGGENLMGKGETACGLR